MQAQACRLAVRPTRAPHNVCRFSASARRGMLLRGATSARGVAYATAATGAFAASLCTSSQAQCIPRSRSWEDIPPQVLKEIQFAIRDGEVGLLKVLLRDHRVSASSTINMSGKTLLAFSAERGQIAAVRYLLKRGADVNATDSRGFTALEYAAWKGHAPVVEALLRGGARADTHDIYGLTPIHKACGFGHAQVVGILVSEGGVSPDFRTGEVTAPADHESAPKQLDAPLHVAARLGNTDTVRLLVENGAEVNARNVHGRTPLHEACRKGHAMAAAVLKCHGADARIRTLQDKTPAQEAVTRTLSLLTKGPAAAHCLATAWC